MQCETCGKHFIEGKKVKIEGCVAVCCNECARYGQIVGDVRPHVEPPKKPVVAQTPKPSQSLSKVLAAELAVPTLKEEYGKLIKDAREKRSLKIDDFAKMLNEPESLMHRIESGKFEPSDSLAHKIESALHIKLFEKSSSMILAGGGHGANKDLTLGDVVVVKRRRNRMNEFYIAFGVLFVLGTLLLLRSKNEKFLGLFFMIRTKHFLSFIDWIAGLAPGLWKFLADLAVVFSFGGLGAAYLSNQRKDSKSLGKILFLAGSFVLLAWTGLFFLRGGLIGIATLFLSFLALASFIKYLSKLKNTSVDYLFSSVLLTFAFMKFVEVIGLMLGSELKIPVYISAIDGAFGIPPLLIGMFMMQAFQILFAGSKMPGVAPMLPSVNTQGELGVAVPGYDIFVPIVYALIAFTVLLFSHEFAHGVLARVHKIKLKSTGLLTFGIVPVGAFVEPDEKELEGRSSIQKMHVFAAGSFANVLVCAVSVIVMFSLSAFLVSSDGVLVDGLTENSTALGIIEKGDVIYSVNNVTLNSSAGYKKTVAGYAPGSRLTLVTKRGSFDVTAGQSPENASVAFLGMFTENNIKGKYGLDIGYLNFIWTTLTWMIFFNLNVALVNLLPIAPFDGWRMLREVMYVFRISEVHAKKIVYAIVAFCLILLLINAQDALPLVNMFLEYANKLIAI